MFLKAASHINSDCMFQCSRTIGKINTFFELLYKIRMSRSLSIILDSVILNHPFMVAMSVILERDKN